MPLVVKKTRHYDLSSIASQKILAAMRRYILKHDVGIVGPTMMIRKRLNSIQAGTKQPFSFAMSVERNPFPDDAPQKGEVA